MSRTKALVMKNVRYSLTEVFGVTLTTAHDERDEFRTERLENIDVTLQNALRTATTKREDFRRKTEGSHHVNSSVHKLEEKETQDVVGSLRDVGSAEGVKESSNQHA